MTTCRAWSYKPSRSAARCRPCQRHEALSPSPVLSKAAFDPLTVAACQSQARSSVHKSCLHPYLKWRRGFEWQGSTCRSHTDRGNRAPCAHGWSLPVGKNSHFYRRRSVHGPYSAQVFERRATWLDSLDHQIGSWSGFPNKANIFCLYASTPG